MILKNPFGTDGIRGQVNIYPITAEFMLSIGRALSFFFSRNQNRKILVGKDTRLSNNMLEHALSAGICSMGTKVCNLGLLPTSGIAYLTRKMNADAGIMISASHNKAHDNGIKIFNSFGFKLNRIQELKILDLALKPIFQNPLHCQIGKTTYIDHAEKEYLTHIKNSLPLNFNLKGFKIVLDCSNGSAYKIGPRLLEELGARILLIENKPNGLNINHDTYFPYIDTIRSLIRKESADLGIILDGDADRLVVIDEIGNLVSGDVILVLFANYLKNQKILEKNTLVCTKMSTLSIEQCLKQNKINTIRTQIGDRNVVEKLRIGGYSFGGEESGHFIFMNHSTTGDGLFSALMLLNIIRNSRNSLSNLRKILNPIPRIIQNRFVKQQIPFKNLRKTSKLISEIEKELGATGRIFVRHSGTESSIRILIEGNNQIKINKMANQLADQIVEESNVHSIN